MKKSFDNALKYFNTGNYLKTIEIIEGIRPRKKWNSNIWNLLAMSYASTDNLIKAEYCFSKSIELNPNDYVCWSNLGLSQLRQGKYNRSLDAFSRSLKINSSFTDALCNTALAFLHLKQYDRSIIFAKKTITLNPQIVAAYNIIGLAEKTSDTNNAIAYFIKAIEINSHYYDAYHNLIDTYLLTNNLEQAEAWSIKCNTVFNDNINSRLTLAKVYEKQNKISEAESSYKKCLDIDRNFAEAIAGIARIDISRDKVEIALSSLKDAIKNTPGDLTLTSELSTLFILQKQYDEAYALLKQQLEINQSASHNTGLLLSYSTACRNSGHIEEAIEKLSNYDALEENTITASETIKYSLASLYDKSQKYDNAFTLYDEANKITHCPSDIAYYSQIFDDITETFPQHTQTLGRYRDVDNEKLSPVFILGMPRSGTSLIERIVASHPDVYGAGEITHLWSIANDISQGKNLIDYCKNIQTLDQGSIDSYSKRYRDEIATLSGINKTRCTDKLPHNFFLIGLIEKLFPDAFIIHCSRHPFDVCLSIYFNNFNANHCYARNLSDLANFYHQYEELMTHWNATSSAKIFNIRYENLIIEPEKHTRALISFAELDWDDACLDYHESNKPIMTPSFDQANQPIYTGSVNRWKNYMKHIDPLRKILGDPESYM